MRIKNLPIRRIRRGDNINCDNVIINSKNLNRLRVLNKSEEHWNITRVQMSGNDEVLEALDLSMPKLSENYCGWNNLQSTIINDTMPPSSVDVALDLSLKTINKNKLGLNVVDYKTILPSTSQNNNEFKNLFLYKMLTDPQFINGEKQSKHTNLITCDYCKRNFSTQNDLYNHQNGIIDERNNNVSCCACEKIFSQRRYLRYHQRCHSEQNKFTCNICTRKYSRQDNLTRHNTFHTNPDKFPCSLCERTFARKDLLNKHIKSHENRYRYHCDTCNKYFRGPLSLENHNRIYHFTAK